MDNFEKQLKRKINIRKTALDNTGLQCEYQFSNMNDDSKNKDEDNEKLYYLLKENIKEADENSFQNGYWYLSGKKVSIFIKKVLRKLVRVFYGWYLFPIMARQSHFNGKTVNSLTILKDIVSTQQQMIDQMTLQYRNLEQNMHIIIDENNQIMQSQIVELTQRIQDQISEKNRTQLSQIDKKNELILSQIDENNRIMLSQIEESNRIMLSQIDEKDQMLQHQIDINNQRLQNKNEEIDKVIHDQICEMEQKISDIKYSMNYFQRQIAPGSRIEVHDKRSIIIDEISNYGLKEKIHQVEQASVEDVNDKLINATEYYENIIQQQIETQTTTERELIVVLCLRFRTEHGMEAIKNEAYDLFQLLLRESIYNVKLVSLEEVVEEPELSDSIIYVDKHNIEECIDQLSPALIVLCESTPYYVFDSNGLLIKNHTLIKLTGHNPLHGLDEKTLDELRHCNDYGVHRYLVESQNAYNMMIENGFRNVVLSYPVINTERIIIKKDSREINNPFVVGFASLPMEEEQFSDRGMDILLESVVQMPNVIFKILWRNELLEVPIELKDAKNCQIFVGKYNMELFYQEIDCVIIPYKTVDNNHACSLSGIEAMLNNIPVISTNIAGISDIVSKYGMGIVCKPTSDDMIAAIKKLYNDYEEYVSPHKAEQVRKFFGSKQIVSIIEETLEDYFPKNFVTLEEWDYHLNKNNKYLVKGHSVIKKYYQNEEIANSYNEVRFLLYPGNYFDAFERATIGIAIKNIFENNNNIEILDIASGDGRIVQEDIKYGNCTSIDSSRAMLDIVEKRFNSSGKIKTVICDYFTDIMEGKYDVITTFRYIRHFDYVQRKILYQRIYNNLKKGGLLIFDVPNIKYAMNTRGEGNWGEFNIYDVFWDEKSILQELRENNFQVQYLIPIGVKSIDRDPVSWTVAASKK